MSTDAFRPMNKIFQDMKLQKFQVEGMLHSHNQLYIYIYVRKHNDDNKDEQTQFFWKIYLSLYSKGFERVTKGIIVWEVSWRLNRTATYWPPLFWPSSISPGLLNWGPSLCWDMVLIPASSLQLIDFLSHPGYIIIWRPPTSCGVTIQTQFNPSTVKVIPRYLRPDAPVIYTGAFLIWLPSRVGGQYVAGISGENI